MTRLPALFLLFVSTAAMAVGPQFWEDNNQQSFSAGDPQFVSVNSDGEVSLAPDLKKIYSGTEPIIWKVVRDSKGILYAATGNDGKVIRIDSTGSAKTLLDTEELGVQALTIDRSGQLFAATSPDGKIYRIKPDGTSSVFFDPEDKYIWSLALDDSGNLYAGTGDQGKIYKIDSTGKGELLIDTSESNITALAWDQKRKILAGSDRNGILYSVDPSGKAFVIYDSDLQQISAIFSDPSGEIYFAAVAGIPAVPIPRPLQDQQRQGWVNQQTEAAQQQAPEGGEEPTAGVTVEVGPVVVAPFPQPTRPAGASQLFRISPDGFPELIYVSDEDQILDIVPYKDGSVLLSTGRKAKLISVDRNKKSMILLRAPEEQITCLIQTAGKTWAATANPANLYELAEAHSASGTFYSDIKDAQATATWGRISWKATIPSGTTLNLFTRSGNTKTPDNTWSDWAGAGTDPAGKQIENPKARFLQWKAELSTPDPRITPVLRAVSIAYLQQNLRPEILSVTVQPPGILFRKQQVYPQDSFAGLDGGLKESAPQQSQGNPGQMGAWEVAAMGKGEYRRGYRTITWNATDQNQDEMKYDLHYRAESEKEWKPLAEDLKERVFAWDTQSMPDGSYAVRVTVSDAPSNPETLALTNSKESSPFDVDNSAPKVELIGKEGKTLHVRATDQYSAILEMMYSVKAGEWVMVFPVDSISDSSTEEYRIDLKQAASEIVIRCTDRVNNTTTVKLSL